MYIRVTWERISGAPSPARVFAVKPQLKGWLRTEESFSSDEEPRHFIEYGFGPCVADALTLRAMTQEVVQEKNANRQVSLGFRFEEGERSDAAIMHLDSLVKIVVHREEAIEELLKKDAAPPLVAG